MRYSVSIPFGRVSVFKEKLARGTERWLDFLKSFHPLWAGLSFQRRYNISIVPEEYVSIPFGRVSVFKVSQKRTVMSQIDSQGFHPLWAGLSFQRHGVTRFSSGRLARFHPLWAGLSFQSYKEDPSNPLTWREFPSPLGGSQFSKKLALGHISLVL